MTDALVLSIKQEAPNSCCDDTMLHFFLELSVFGVCGCSKNSHHSWKRKQSDMKKIAAWMVGALDSSGGRILVEEQVLSLLYP
jgi:hypothetical protein